MTCDCCILYSSTASGLDLWQTLQIVLPCALIGFGCKNIRDLVQFSRMLCNVLQADILMVTDGEIPAPSDWVKRDLKKATEEKGLEVHGLMVGQQDSTPAMEQFCTHLHVFKSWSAVGGKRSYWY